MLPQSLRSLVRHTVTPHRTDTHTASIAAINASRSSRAAAVATPPGSTAGYNYVPGGREFCLVLVLDFGLGVFPFFLLFFFFSSFFPLVRVGLIVF
jgi:hypothetical protein